MAMRPDPPKATKPDLASLSGAGRAYALPLEFIAHNNGGAHPAEKIGGLTSAAKLDLEVRQGGLAARAFLQQTEHNSAAQRLSSLAEFLQSCQQHPVHTRPSAATFFP